MKIAFSSTGTSLEDQIDPRFGRCQYFVIVDTDTMAVEAIQNTSAGAVGGAGISSAQTIAAHGAQVVITGGVGPNADQALSAAGIQIITGVSGVIRDAVESYRSGDIKSTMPSGGATPTGAGTGAGYGRGMGMGMGTGMGRGMGMGGGRGGGRGRGLRRWAGTQAPVSQATPPVSSDDFTLIQQQIAEILERLEQIDKRLRNLEK